MAFYVVKREKSNSLDAEHYKVFHVNFKNNKLTFLVYSNTEGWKWIPAEEYAPLSYLT